MRVAECAASVSLLTLVFFSQRTQKFPSLLADTKESTVYETAKCKMIKITFQFQAPLKKELKQNSS